MSPKGTVREECVTSNFFLTEGIVKDGRRIGHMGNMRGSGERPEEKPEAWGLFLDTPISQRKAEMPPFSHL